MLRIATLALTAVTTSCMSTPPEPFVPKPTHAYGTPIALGELVWLNEPYTSIMPVEVLEDSRCPPNARCVWEGQVRLRVVVTKDPQPGIFNPQNNMMPVAMEIGGTEPSGIFGGNIAIEQIAPSPAETGQTIDPEDYRFSFSFTFWEAAN